MRFRVMFSLFPRKTIYHRQAHVRCPKCGFAFVVRDITPPTTAEQKELWRAVDELFLKIDHLFDSLFR